MTSYCVSKKSWPNLYSNVLCKIDQDFLDRQFIIEFKAKIKPKRRLKDKQVFLGELTHFYYIILEKVSCSSDIF